MIWLTWRQLRTQAGAACTAVTAAALVLALTGPRLARLASLDENVFDRLTASDRNLFYAGIVVMAVAPALLGAFWGAPLVARELEAGTHRLVWNQSVTRTRWLATKLGGTVLAAAVAVGALTLAVSWWADPIDGAVSETHGALPARLTPVSFAMRGIAPVGYAVFAVVLGATLGVVVRRSLVAMALTLALFTAMQVLVPILVRPHLAPPAREAVTLSRERLDGLSRRGETGDLVITVSAASSGDWILSNETVDASGRPTALPAWMVSCLPGLAPPGAPSRVEVRGGADAIGACLDRLNAEGYRQALVFQPANRFWALQWAETGLYLTLSALLAGLCFWWTGTRLS